MIEDIRKEIKERGYRVVYKPHAVMKDYNATYNVIYDGKRITNPAGIKLKIPPTRFGSQRNGESTKNTFYSTNSPRLSSGRWDTTLMKRITLPRWRA